MQGQQINLKWKGFHSSILSSFESLWEEEGLVDVTLATDGQCLKAHKIVLSASSPFFKKIFQTHPCQHPIIVLQDVHFSELESILNFVYKGEVNILQDNLPLLLRAAETLQIRGLCGDIADERTSKEELDSDSQSHERTGLKTPPTSPKNIKRLKTHHTYKSSPLLQAPTTELLVPVFPVAVDEIKSEPMADSPTRSDDRFDNPAEFSNTPHIRIIDSEEEENDLSSNTNESAFDLDQASKKFPYPPFPCPFCDRAYTRWGFRRRHIKACHTRSQSLPCKWCFEISSSHAEWESHVCSKHNLSRSDAKNGLLILEEAEVVLQIPQPTRLETLVTMIKEQKSDQSENKSETLNCNKETDNKGDTEEADTDKEPSPKWVSEDEVAKSLLKKKALSANPDFLHRSIRPVKYSANKVCQWTRHPLQDATELKNSSAMCREIKLLNSATLSG